MLFVYDGTAWKSSESTTYVNASAPATAVEGELWWDVTNLRLKIRLSGSWVAIAPRYYSQASAPSSGMEAGDWWYNSTTGAFSMYIAGSINAWTLVSSGGGSGGGGGSINDILAFG